jgi:hypothetical protein
VVLPEMARAAAYVFLVARVVLLVAVTLKFLLGHQVVVVRAALYSFRLQRQNR